MLRLLVALLFIANLGFWGWTQGWLDNVVGVKSIGDREPERLDKQVRPDAIKVLTPQAVQAVASEAESRLTCLESGPIAAEQINAAQRALSTAMPGVAFASVKSERPGSYLIYMGRYPTLDAMKRKREELARTKLPFEEVTVPSELAPGYTLGSFETRTAADAALERYALRGVRTARVVEAAKPTASYRLRIARADPETAGKLFAIRSEALGSGFGGCATDAAGTDSSTPASTGTAAGTAIKGPIAAPTASTGSTAASAATPSSSASR